MVELGCEQFNGQCINDTEWKINITFFLPCIWQLPTSWFEVLSLEVIGILAFHTEQANIKTRLDLACTVSAICNQALLMRSSDFI